MESTTATAERHEYLTVEEAARHFRVSAPTIYRRCADGTLPHVRIGAAGPIRIPAAELDRLLEPIDDDGSRQGQLRADTDPAERRESQNSGQSSSRQPAGLGEGQ